MVNYREILAASAGVIQSLGPLEPALVRAVELVSQSLRGGHKLLACGNGGSAADASHLATEFVVRFCKDRRPYPAIAFNDSGGTLTAVGNDYGFDQVFARQVKAFGQKGDVLVVFSTSGKSRNVVLALEAAKEVGVASVAFLGRDGGACKGLAAVELIVANDSTARIQEAHHVLIHALCEMVEERLGR